ncbi:uncharacterized protein [Phaseolus vulgaris]|uniref:uncharacterized protein n=2 Tax=Phaseolus vulgaris TaxID=3885 RepID=UPI0035CB9F06
MMFLHRVCITEGKENMYGFLDPAYTNPVGPNSTETQAYITNILEKEGKQIYLCPYINEHHWQLLVLSMVDKTAVWFCSLHKKMPTKFKDIIDTSWRGYNILKGRSSSNNLNYIRVKCNKQPGSYECGYYIMQWMITIIRLGVKTGWKELFTEETPMSEEGISYVRDSWSTYFINFYNSSIGKQ